MRRTDYSIVESHKSKVESTLKNKEISSPSEVEITNQVVSSTDLLQTPDPRPQTLDPSPQTPNPQEEIKISALSLSSIRAKKELQESNKSLVKEEVQHATEAFNETDMLLHWSKYAQRLGDKGHKIMESLILITNPKLDGTTIIHELPNDGSKIEFETEKQELLGYLRGKLHNHDISIEVIVNEKVEQKFAFTAQDKFNRLNEINPNLELLKRTFDLDI